MALVVPMGAGTVHQTGERQALTTGGEQSVWLLMGIKRGMRGLREHMCSHTDANKSKSKSPLGLAS